MNLDLYLSSVLTDLDRATALADEQTRQVAGKVAAAVEPALRLALVHALSDAAAHVTSELTDATVVLRMEGRDPVLTVHRTHIEPPVPPVPPAPAAPSSPSPVEPEDAETARLTVRLPQFVKTAIERLAADADQSVNTWIVQALRAATTSATNPQGSAGGGPGATGQPTAYPQSAPIQTSRRITGWA